MESGHISCKIEPRKIYRGFIKEIYMILCKEASGSQPEVRKESNPNRQRQQINLIEGW